MRRHLGSEHALQHDPFDPLPGGANGAATVDIGDYAATLREGLDVPAVPPAPVPVYPVPVELRSAEPVPVEPVAMPQRHRVREFRVTRTPGLQRLATALHRFSPSLSVANPSLSRTQAHGGSSPGGYECEFVDPLEELHLVQTKCPICLLIPRKPYMVTCCCHKFCESCIRQVNESRGPPRARRRPCPLCNAVTYSLVHEKDLERTLNGLKVRCSRQKDGCQWTGELGQLELHLNETPSEDTQMEGCIYVQIPCPNDCDKKFQRRVIQAHEQECTRRRYSCSYCHGFTSTYKDVKKNHWPQCDKFPLSCPNNCGSAKITRSELPRHLESCPNHPVECEFSHAGCTVKVPRRKLGDHLKVNMAAHMSLLAKQNARLMQELVEVKGRLSAVEGKVSVTSGEGSEGEMDVERAEARERDSSTPPALVPSERLSAV